MGLGGQELAVHRRLRLDAKHLCQAAHSSPLETQCPLWTLVHLHKHTNKKEFTSAKMVN